MTKNTFRAQALAIVMVVLVISSIIGVSLFSRMSKNKQTAVNEQDSSIASTIVDSALDFFVGSDIEEIEEVLGEDADERVEFSYASLEDLLTDLRKKDIVSDSITIQKDQVWCQGESNQQVILSYAEGTDYVEVQPGSVMAYNIEDVSPDSSPCQLGVRLRAVQEHAIFVVKKIYDHETEVSESISNYCMLKDSGGPCPANIAEVEYDDSTFSEVTWDTDDSAHVLNLNFLEKDLVEVRILPIKGTIAVNNNTWSSGSSTCVDKQFKFIKITAEANCNDSYRGKQMFLPGSGCLGYSTLFDYGIYDTGMFQP